LRAALLASRTLHHEPNALAGERGGTVMFSREADDAVQAIVSAIEDLEATGMTVAGVTEAAAKLGEVDHVAAETAGACALTDAALVVRKGLRELPKHDRPLIAHLVG
jgi:hypothetical protein